ncbi:MAG: Na+ dependent nucleoside transporter N-terminal domain-containing protein, partial [Bacteroidota bacterium]
MRKVIGLLLMMLTLLSSAAGFAQDSTLETSKKSQFTAEQPDSMISLTGDQNMAQAPDTTSSDTTAAESQNILLNNEDAMGFSFESLYRGILGMIIIILIAFIFSSNRKAINWKVVFIGLSIQVILAIGVLTVPFVQGFFEFVSRVFVKILSFTNAGSEFLLGDLMDSDSFGYIFAFQVLPTIVFFSALTSVLFYLGVIQKIVYALAWLMTKAMRLSGAESLSVAGNIFLGQTESPLMVKAYLERMTKSEILLVMLGGMATLAGGVLAAYISFLGDGDPAQELLFAKHLLAASIMAAPGAVVVSKILVPQTEKIDQDVSVSQDKLGSNF